jgi:hypothetical protein
VDEASSRGNCCRCNAWIGMRRGPVQTSAKNDCRTETGSLKVNDDAVATTEMTDCGTRTTGSESRADMGVSDKNCWLNNGPKFRKLHPERLLRPLPFDPDYLPAPAFFALRTSFGKTMKEQDVSQQKRTARFNGGPSFYCAVSLFHDSVEQPEEAAREQCRDRQRKHPRQGNITQRGHLQTALVRGHGASYA